MTDFERVCGTVAILQAQEQEAQEMRAKLTPEQFRVWQIKQNAPYHHLSNKAFGTPLPPELEE